MQIYTYLFIMETNGQRISQVITKLFKSKADFARKIGEKPQTISNWCVRQNSETILKKIIKACPEINDVWLITGKGDMLNKSNYNLDNDQTPIKSYASGVPYYNVDFLGGFDLIVNDQTINPEYYIQFKPYDKATCWCNITGHSMEPEINHGDIIALREIHDTSFLPYGEIYAIVTANDMRTVKRIGPSSNPDNYTLIPTNKSPEYGIQELPKNMILRIFEVMGCMKKF